MDPMGMAIAAMGFIDSAIIPLGCHWTLMYTKGRTPGTPYHPELLILRSYTAPRDLFLASLSIFSPTNVGPVGMMGYSNLHLILDKDKWWYMFFWWYMTVHIILPYMVYIVYTKNDILWWYNYLDVWYTAKLFTPCDSAIPWRKKSDPRPSGTEVSPSMENSSNCFPCF